MQCSAILKCVSSGVKMMAQSPFFNVDSTLVGLAIHHVSGERLYDTGIDALDLNIFRMCSLICGSFGPLVPHMARSLILLRRFRSSITNATTPVDLSLSEALPTQPVVYSPVPSISTFGFCAMFSLCLEQSARVLRSCQRVFNLVLSVFAGLCAR